MKNSFVLSLAKKTKSQSVWLFFIVTNFVTQSIISSMKSEFCSNVVKRPLNGLFGWWITKAARLWSIFSWISNTQFAIIQPINIYAYKYSLIRLESTGEHWRALESIGEHWEGPEDTNPDPVSGINITTGWRSNDRAFLSLMARLY